MSKYHEEPLDLSARIDAEIAASGLTPVTEEQAQTMVVVLTAKSKQMHPPLPADPEGNNDRRAELAEYAILPFIEEFGDDRTALVDLLADLRHWCDRHEVDFQDALDSAFNHYQAETTAEEDSE